MAALKDSRAKLRLTASRRCERVFEASNRFQGFVGLLGCQKHICGFSAYFFLVGVGGGVGVLRVSSSRELGRVQEKSA